MAQKMDDDVWQQRTKRRFEDGPDQDFPSLSDDGRRKRSRHDSSPLSVDSDSLGNFSDDPQPSASSTSGSSTHDTSASTFHYPSFHAWTRDLETALKTSWKSRNDPALRYRSVKALLVSCEDDDLGVEKEVNELAQLFTRVYSYDAEKWKIPSLGSWSALDDKVRTADRCPRSGHRPLIADLLLRRPRPSERPAWFVSGLGIGSTQENF
ncbi:hypothetical protein B0T14DRAFT_39681 [Immersiella caudata]|uniref:Uncharacterized protein n=1 Tax=Immersiella caudata TaxID=314043 RepID=A0AA40CBH5_9PEZI|nr:hypothetical protein B0T14DRAFT_39681 [Immersiella caudata]